MTNRIAGCAIRDGIPDFAMRDAQDVQSKQSKRERNKPSRKGSLVPCLTAFPIHHGRQALTTGKIPL
jgi:hypothetical protein